MPSPGPPTGAALQAGPGRPFGGQVKAAAVASSGSAVGIRRPAPLPKRSAIEGRLPLPLEVPPRPPRPLQAAPSASPSRLPQRQGRASLPARPRRRLPEGSRSAVLQQQPRQQKARPEGDSPFQAPEAVSEATGKGEPIVTAGPPPPGRRRPLGARAMEKKLLEGPQPVVTFFQPGSQHVLVLYSLQTCCEVAAKKFLPKSHLAKVIIRDNVSVQRIEEIKVKHIEESKKKVSNLFDQMQKRFLREQQKKTSLWRKKYSYYQKMLEQLDQQALMRREAPPPACIPLENQQDSSIDWVKQILKQPAKKR